MAIEGKHTLGIKQIVAGGQTGVDRAALDAALAAGIPVGGWCPRGRRAEDGPIAAHYPLVETPSTDHAQRTAWNVRDSDGTLILVQHEPSGGTALTVEEAHRQNRPVLLVDPADGDKVRQVADWIDRHHIHVLNVAGPRESEAPGIYEVARHFIEHLLSNA